MVAEVIDLERFRAKMAADHGFRTWLARFHEQFGPETRLQDLSPSTLLYLASPREENLYVVFDLVMGIRGLGSSVRFRLDDMEDADKMKVMDTVLALVDRVRFELMRRLGWVEEIPGGESPIIQLAQQAWRQETGFAREVPCLSQVHPDYETYARLNPMDRAVFIRRLIPRAVAAFQKRLETGEQS